MPSLVYSKAEHEAKLVNALTRLSSARREKLEKQDYAVYADSLREFPIDVVIRVCEDLGRIAPAEYQPRFPPLHLIRSECVAILARRNEIANERRLAARKQEPASPERLEQFLRDVKAAVAKKAMR